MPEIKVQHVVSCSTEDNVSYFLSWFGVNSILVSVIEDCELCNNVYDCFASCGLIEQTHKADNLLSSDTYRKWKAAKPGEKQTSVILQVCVSLLSSRVLGQQ